MKNTLKALCECARAADHDGRSARRREEDQRSQVEAHMFKTVEPRWEGFCGRRQISALLSEGMERFLGHPEKSAVSRFDLRKRSF